MQSQSPWGQSQEPETVGRSSEARFSYNQPVRTTGGQLTVRGDTYNEIASNLAEVGLNPDAIFGEPSPVASGPQQDANGAWSNPGAQQATSVPGGPMCQHGARVENSGRSARGPWKAWFCPLDRDDPNRCKPMNADGTLWK